MNKDLTVGEPSSVLWKFCLPLFGSIIFQQLYNIADSFVAGKFVGEDALAAVGNSYEITLIFIAFAFGCNIGCSVIVSNLFGAKKYKDLKTAVYTTLITSAIVCAILMIAELFFGTNLLHLINTPDNILADSKLYLDIYTLGLPFVFYYNVSTGIFSALGDSKTPFIFLMISSLSNIVIDILFVTTFSSIFTRGVDGVAWSTFLCQSISCIVSLIFVFKRLKNIYIFLNNPVGTAIDVGIIFLKIVAPFYFIISTKLVADGILRGSGMMNKFMVSTFTDLIIRVILAKILSIYFGTTGIWVAWPIGWCISAVLSVLFYHTGEWNHCPKEEN